MERYELRKGELAKIKEESKNDINKVISRITERSKQGGKGKDKEDTRLEVQYRIRRSTDRQTSRIPRNKKKERHKTDSKIQM